MKSYSPHINLTQMEQGILAKWEAENTFYRSNEQRLAQNKEYSFYDGPPFANGLPHYGHMLATTIKDIVARYWNMRGYYVERRFGWDCHGLPVEYQVEKELNLSGRQAIIEYGVDKFNEACRKSVLHYAHEWKKTVTRIGRWVDWNNQYHTMDLTYMESVWWVFKQLYEQGLVYRGLKIVAYSPRTSAVVSNFEANQNYKEVQDPSIVVKFKAQDEDAYFLAWTTTPWSLIANLALVVHPELDYVKIQDPETQEVYYLAKERLEFIATNNSPSQKYKVLNQLKGKELMGRRYEPLFPYFSTTANAFQILGDDFVSLDSGTGIVHAAPAYGEDDFRVCQAHGIPIVDPLDEAACYTKDVPEFAGQYIKDADKAIMRHLKERNLLLKQSTIVHSYPHCDRTNDPLIYRAIPTWYIAVEKIRDLLVQNNKKIRWVPEHLRDGRMGRWLENARDWAVSRNRFWGTPLPIWVSDRDENVFEVIGSVKELEEKTGKKITDLHKHFIEDLTWPCPKTGGTMRVVGEVFDCWFESGSMPYAQNHYPFENVEKFEKSFPADFIAEGQDQTRGWFYSLAVISNALFQKPAFKNVIVNGMILASDGKKMSKRLRNYTPPDELLDKFGADSVRLYMVNSPVLRAEDLRFSDDGVKETTRSVILPLWNALSFLTTYAEADNWQPDMALVQGKVPHSDNDMDRWIISRLQSVKSAVHKQMEEYKLYNVVPEMLSFIEELTNWYIRLNRRRFWADKNEASNLQTQEAFATLYHVLLEFSQIFAPFAPFISEKIYLALTEGLVASDASVHLCDIPQAHPALIDNALEQRMALIQRVTSLGRSLRAKQQIKTRQPLPNILIITPSQEDQKHIENARDLILNELNVKDLSFSTDEQQYLHLSLKPNLKILGKKLGKRLAEFRKLLEEINNNKSELSRLLTQIEAGQPVELMGQSFDPQDFLIERKARDERLLATEQGVSVLLDTQLNDQLIAEGLARELINRIQKLRKDSQLNVSDRIKLVLFAPKRLGKAAQQFSDLIKSETLAVEFKIYDLNEANKPTTAHKTEELIDGMTCTICLQCAPSTTI